MGRQATKLSKSLGVDIDKLEDPRYGEVNIYHETILRQVFEPEQSALPEPKPPTQNPSHPPRTELLAHKFQFKEINHVYQTQTRY
jgi:hypothetical protein